MSSFPAPFPMPVITPRLLLRPLDPADADAIHAARRESREALSRWGIWMFGPPEDMIVSEDEEFCRRKRGLFDSGEDMTLLVTDRHSGECLGGAGLHKCDWKQRTFSLGFWIRSAALNQGYASEAGTALAYYAFEVFSATKITSMHAQGNMSSQRVLDKIGFSLKEILPAAHELPGGARVDEYRYEIGNRAMLPPLAVCWGE